MSKTITTTASTLIWFMAISLWINPVMADTSSPEPKAGVLSNSKGTAATADGKTTAASKSPVAPAMTKKPLPLVDPNRRWIMKQRDHSGKKIKPKPVSPMKWRSPAQKSSCHTRLKPLANAFDQARFYAIQGDRCKTAQYARTFIDTAKGCQTSCPEGFLERNGYNEQVIRNMHQLQALGAESCTGKKSPAAGKTTAERHPAPSGTKP